MSAHASHSWACSLGLYAEEAQTTNAKSASRRHEEQRQATEPRSNCYSTSRATRDGTQRLVTTVKQSLVWWRWWL